MLALVAILAVVGSAFWFAVLADPPDAPIGLHIPWWVLALMFAATELWVFHIQVGREAKSISISEIPLVLALFYAMPPDLLVARVVGPALVVLLHRRQTLLKAAVNITLFYADTAVALAVFCWVGGGSTADSGPDLGRCRARGRRLPSSSTWSCSTRSSGGTTAAPRLARVRSVAHGRRHRDRVGHARPGAVLTLRLGPLAAVPLLAAGVVLMVGYRAYASLADRHTSLERLFTLQPRAQRRARVATDVLPAVLDAGAPPVARRGRRGRALRRAGTSPHGAASAAARDAAATRRGGPGGSTMVRRLLEAQEPLLLRSDARRRRRLSSRLRDAGEAAARSAALRRPRRSARSPSTTGSVRCAASPTSDVQLLQTVANHASVALHNEMLIGRLRHDALHDTLTGLPNRSQLVSAGDQRRCCTPARRQLARRR